MFLDYVSIMSMKQIASSTSAFLIIREPGPGRISASRDVEALCSLYFHSIPLDVDSDY